MASSNDDILIALGRLQASMELSLEALKAHIDQDNNRFEKMEKYIDEVAEQTASTSNTLNWYAGAAAVITPIFWYVADVIKTKVGA